MEKGKGKTKDEKDKGQKVKDKSWGVGVSGVTRHSLATGVGKR
jgi:hypothetical protein